MEGTRAAMANINLFYCEVYFSVQEFGSNLPTGALDEKTKIGSNTAKSKDQKTYLRKSDDATAAKREGHAQCSWFWYGYGGNVEIKYGGLIVGMAAVWAGRLWMLYWGGVQLLWPQLEVVVEAHYIAGK